MKTMKNAYALLAGTRVVQILYDSPAKECDGDGCAETAPDYVE